VITVDLSPGLVRTVMGASRPDADEIAPEAWMSPSIAADKVEALLSGRYDRLHGHFLHARDDLDAVAAAVDGSRRRVCSVSCPPAGTTPWSSVTRPRRGTGRSASACESFD